MPTHPEPLAQLRERLAVAKRQGISFERAWKGAWFRLKMPHDTAARRAEREAMTWAKPYFEAAYNDEHVPGGSVLISLVEALRVRDETEPSGPRDAPLVITSKEAAPAERGSFVPDFAAKNRAA